jgi:hypothetical protein
MATLAIAELSLILTHKMSTDSSEAARKHPALIWLIRNTGAFIACASLLIGSYVLALIAFNVCRAHPLDFIAILVLLLLALGLYGIRRTGIALAVIFSISACYFFGCLVVTASQGQPQFSNFGWFGVPLYVLGMLALLWLLGFVFWLFVTKGYDMWRKIDKITVADFASVFAFVAACVFRYFLPVHLPNFVNDHLWVAIRDPFSHIGSRSSWFLLAIYVFYKLIKAYLFQILGLNSSPPQNPTPPAPDDTDAPDRSFVPFNPYDLSKNPPYLPPSSS